MATDIDRFDAGTILRVPETEPERLFGPDPTHLAVVFRRLALRWHPDRSREARATEVFAHVSLLHGIAERRAAAGDWRTPGRLRLTDRRTGKTFDLAYRRRHDVETGEVYVSRTTVAYALTRDCDDLAEAAVRNLGHIHLPATMEKDFSWRMPKLIARVDAEDRTVLVMAKAPDQLLLRDLIAHQGGRLDARHVAWIVRELEMLACVLASAGVGMAHAGLGPDTILVEPGGHACVLVGGWEYAAPLGSRLLGAPARIVDHLPPTLLSGGVASEAVTLDTIRLIAAEALGHASPTMARGDAAIPQPLRDWMMGIPAPTAVQDYAAWPKVRDSSFGERRFVPLTVDLEAVYPPI